MSFIKILLRLYVVVAVFFLRFADLLVKLLASLVSTDHLTVGFHEHALRWSQILNYLFSDRFEQIYVCWGFYFIDSRQILHRLNYLGVRGAVRGQEFGRLFRRVAIGHFAVRSFAQAFSTGLV